MSSPAEASARRAYDYRGHTVIASTLAADTGTQALRFLIEEVGGVRTVAKMIGLDPEEIARWTREGAPKVFWAKIKELSKLCKGTDDLTRQNPLFSSDAQFSVLS